MQPCTDLVIRARAGDRAALEPLFRAVQDDVYRLLLAELRHEADAEDASQETFRQAMESIGSLRDAGAFPAWLFRIALEKARNVRRRGAAERRAAEVLARRSTATEEEPMSHAEKNELGGRIGMAVEALEPELRTAVRLRYEHGMTYEQIAEATDAPGGTVAWRLSEAHRRLQKTLAAAGAVVALAALERELEAAPRAAAPERLSKALKRIAHEGPRRGVQVSASSPRARRVAMTGVALVTVVAIVFIIRSSRGDAEKGHPTAALPNAGAARPDGSPSAGPDELPASAPRNPVPPAVKPVLTGRVFDRDAGTAVAEVEVLLVEGSAFHPGKTVARTLSRADGTFEISGPAGVYMLETKAAGFVNRTMERYEAQSSAAMSERDIPFTAAELEALFGASVTLVAGIPCSQDVPLLRTASVTGRVLDEAGAGMPDVTVTVSGQSIPCPRGSFAIQTVAEGTTKSDSQGRFRFDNLYPTGVTGVRASREGFVDGKTTVHMTPGTSETTLTLRPKPIVVMVDVTVVVRGLDGGPLAGAVVLAGGERDESGMRKLEPLSAPFGVDGSLQARLSADTPWIACWSPGRGIAVRAFGDRGEGPIDLTPPEAAKTVRGCVLDADGRPVSGALVQVSEIAVPVAGTEVSLSFETDSDSGGMSSMSDRCVGAFMPSSCRAPSARTGADGSFTIEGVFLVEGGRVELVAAASGFTFGYSTVKGPQWAEIRVEEAGE